MTWGTRGRAQHSIEAVLGTCFGEPVLPCLMDFDTFSYFNGMVGLCCCVAAITAVLVLPVSA